jgi:DNA-binding response OmpR family regulator
VDPKPGPETPLAASDRARGRVPLRILIVEDNVDAAATLRDYLEMDGHQVCIASTGTEGVDAASRFLPHVVLCDIGLPGMNGWDVARSVRAAPATAASRLIAITGYGTDDDRRLSAEAGFEAHLTKPLDMDALEAVLDPRP